MSFPPAAPGELPISFQLVLGLWLFASGAVWEQPFAARVSCFLAGAGIAVASAVALSRRRAQRLNTALALWVAFSSAVLFRLQGPPGINALLVAAAVFTLSLLPAPRRRPR